MRDDPTYALTDPAEVRALVRAHPWATLASATPDGVVVSHYPFLLDEGADGLVLLSHVGRPDERAHRLGASEVVVVFSGPHGYVSPSWYGLGHGAPTWNFAAVHAYGTPEVLSDRENLDVLERLVDRFEGPLPTPLRMRGSAENTAYTARIARGTVGFRLPVTRVVAKDKMSQDKPPEVVDRVLAALEAPGPYRNPALAERMRRARRTGRRNGPGRRG